VIRLAQPSDRSSSSILRYRRQRFPNRKVLSSAVYIATTRLKQSAVHRAHDASAVGLAKGGRSSAPTTVGTLHE
jgi:hypothetical protein